MPTAYTHMLLTLISCLRMSIKQSVCAATPTRLHSPIHGYMLHVMMGSSSIHARLYIVAFDSSLPATSERQVVILVIMIQ